MAIEQWLVDGQKTIDIEHVRRIRVGLVGGSIAVLAHDEPATRVEVAATSVRDLKVAVDGDTLIIDHPQLRVNEAVEGAKNLWKGPKADVSVLVPQHCDVDVKATSAEVLVVGVTGAVSVSTTSGEQFVDGTTGALTLSAVDAEISVRDHDGTVTTRTIAGDVTASGAIARYSGNTISGATVLDITSGLPDRISNRSVAGSTTIRIPAEVTPDYRVSTVTAVADLEGETTQPARGRTYTSPTSAHTKRLTAVHLQSVAGRITVVRAAGSTAAQEHWGGPAGTLVKPGPDTAFRRIVKSDFDERIDERVASAATQLGVEAEGAQAPDAGDSDAQDGTIEGTASPHTNAPDVTAASDDGEVRA